MDTKKRAEEVVKMILADEKPVLGTNDISPRFDVSQQAMFVQLQRMEDAGYLNTDKIGRSRVWWPTQAGLSLLNQD